MTNKRAGTRPPWLKIRVPGDLQRLPVTRMINDLGLNTVCQEARCPNIFECWGAGTATFMLLGETCTRRCTFCAVGKGVPAAPDQGEPERVADAVERMGVKHCVITTVNRDDLSDGGAEHFARTIEAVRSRTGASVEVLISDLQGDRAALRTVLAARPEVLAHNVETIPRLYLQVRPGSRYQRSLDVLRWAHEDGPEGILTKSSLMLGLGENEEEILGVARDLRTAGVDIFTMGQYLAPSERNHPVRRYYAPEEFDELGGRARAMGFHHVESGPLVRSSYMAHRAVESPAEAAHAEDHVR
ncbi:MAG TPA: lipoyl synthase [Thermoanaerobaculia bacterium]|nr:lipoyl synthase [Thermoanaerobaculia bacterium]